MTAYLQRDGYIINHKKVYRIMDQTNLLQQRVPRNHTGKKFVKFRKVETTRPFECLEMDIKVVWIPQAGKNAYLLSILEDRKSTRLNSSHVAISYAVFCLKEKSRE